MTVPPAYDQLDLIAAPIFVLELRDDGVPVYAAFNAQARAVSGRPLSDYLGRTAEEVYPGEWGRIAFAEHCSAARTGTETCYDLTLPLAGRMRHVRTTLRPDLDAAGRVRRLYGSARDMTAEQEILAAKAEHETAATEMEQFIALAAHDLRAPMRNVAMLAEVLREDFNDHGDGKLELINMLGDLSNSTMELIGEVLTHAQTIDVRRERSTFELPELTRAICEVLDPHGQHDVHIPAITLHCDRTAMQVALRNLMENAVKHGGGARIRIDVDVVDQGNGVLGITVSDNGSGFSESGLKLMNGGTFRVDSGYGLFGVRRIIRARGGEISAANNPQGGGAQVRFTLPGHLVPSAEETPPAPTPGPETPQSATAPRHGTP